MEKIQHQDNSNFMYSPTTHTFLCPGCGNSLESQVFKKYKEISLTEWKTNRIIVENRCFYVTCPHESCDCSLEIKCALGSDGTPYFKTVICQESNWLNVVAKSGGIIVAGFVLSMGLYWIFSQDED